MQEEVKNEIRMLAKAYRDELDLKIKDRIKEMENDNNSHFLIYRILGISIKEGYSLIFIKIKGDFCINMREVF